MKEIVNKKLFSFTYTRDLKEKTLMKKLKEQCPGKKATTGCESLRKKDLNTGTVLWLSP